MTVVRRSGLAPSGEEGQDESDSPCRTAPHAPCPA